MRNILENIKTFRHERGYSQEYMAEQLGVTQAGYANWEKGNRELSYNNLLSIAKVFGVEVWNLIAYPMILIDQDSIPKSEEKVSITFEVDATKRDYLLRLVMDGNTSK